MQEIWNEELYPLRRAALAVTAFVRRAHRITTSNAQHGLRGLQKAGTASTSRPQKPQETENGDIVMRTMSKIAIINLKGGVGKSVTACNLACLLAETWSRRVLVMDLDQQGNTTKFFNRFAYGRKTMGDVLTLNSKMQDVIMQTDFEHVDLAPSNMEMLLANKNVMLDVLRPGIAREEDLHRQSPGGRSL